VTSTGALDVTAKCTRFAASGLGMKATGSSEPVRNVRLRKRLRRRLRRQQRRPPRPGGGGETADGGPGNNDTTPAGPSAPPLPLSLRTTMLARNLNSLTRRAPTSQWRYAHATTAPRLFRLQRPQTQHGSKPTCRSYARSAQVRSRSELSTRARQQRRKQRRAACRL